jgi:hypothetical protein
MKSFFSFVLNMKLMLKQFSITNDEATHLIAARCLALNLSEKG